MRVGLTYSRQRSTCSSESGTGDIYHINSLGQALTDFVGLIKSKLMSLPMTASKMKALVFIPLEKGNHDSAVSMRAQKLVVLHTDGCVLREAGRLHRGIFSLIGRIQCGHRIRGRGGKSFLIR